MVLKHFPDSFPGGSAGKKSSCSVGDLGSSPGLGRSAGEGKGYPLQYSGLENSMDFIVYGVAKSQTRLSDFSLKSTSVRTEKIKAQSHRPAMESSLVYEVQLERQNASSAAS